MVIFNSFLYVYRRVNSDGWGKNAVKTAVTTTVGLRLGGTVETREESQNSRKEQDPFIGLPCIGLINMVGTSNLGSLNGH